MEGAYKYTGMVRYYYYDSICDYGYIAPSKMISNYGLPCAGDGTITQCAGSCGYSVTIAPTGCVGWAIAVWEWQSGGPWPERNLGESSCQNNLNQGNPINVATGNKFQKEIDVEEGLTPMALSFTPEAQTGSRSAG